MASDPTDPALIARVEDLRRAYEADAADGFALALGLEERHPYIEVAADLRALLARVRELEAEREREGAWRRQAIRIARAVAIEDAARLAFDQTSDAPMPGGWNDACEHIAGRIRALASAPAEGGG